jgi:hypothetical protein
MNEQTVRLFWHETDDPERIRCGACQAVVGREYAEAHSAIAHTPNGEPFTMEMAVPPFA